MKNKIILLIGPKHCGKSCTGRALAEITGRIFYDLDEVIEANTGKPARALYREGVEIFRRAEAAAVSGLLAVDGSCVAAAGGGIIDNQAAMNLLAGSANAFLVYLEISAETAWKRIAGTSAGGELPAFLDKTNPQKSHSEIHARRSHLYRDTAHLTIAAENKSPREIAQEISGHVK